MNIIKLPAGTGVHEIIMMDEIKALVLYMSEIEQADTWLYFNPKTGEVIPQGQE